MIKLDTKELQVAAALDGLYELGQQAARTERELVGLLIGLVKANCSVLAGEIWPRRVAANQRAIDWLEGAGYLVAVQGRPGLYAWVERVAHEDQ